MRVLISHVVLYAHTLYEFDVFGVTGLRMCPFFIVSVHLCLCYMCAPTSGAIRGSFHAYEHRPAVLRSAIVTK